LKIDFLVCGAQKSGTSAMDVLLRQHKQISMASQKEVHFFDTDSRFDGTDPDYSHYNSFFRWDQEAVVRGESTPIYMYWPPSMERVARYNPAMKCIAVLRDPVDRAFSHWSMETERGRELRSFADAIRDEADQIASDSGSSHDRIGSYLARGMYALQIRRMWEHVPQENTLFIRYQDFVSDHQETMKRIFRFLGVDDEVGIQNEIVFAQEYRCSIDPGDRAVLCEFFESDIRETEALLGWDCSSWAVNP